MVSTYHNESAPGGRAHRLVPRRTGSRRRAELRPQVLLTYTAQGHAVQLDAGAEGAEFMFGSGDPIGEPIVYGGPFVMTTAAQMTETKRRHARGEMGVLLPTLS